MKYFELMTLGTFNMKMKHTSKLDLSLERYKKKIMLPLFDSHTGVLTLTNQAIFGYEVM